jgi:hypothetical protein
MLKALNDAAERSFQSIIILLTHYKTHKQFLQEKAAEATKQK